MQELSLTTKLNEPIVLGLGFFDCVHLGHRALIQHVFKSAERFNAKTAITTFSNNPYKVFNSESKLIFTYDERLSVFDSLGLDYCLPLRFNTYFKNIDRDSFLQMLFSNFNIVALVCGYDYLFGAGGKGDASYLKDVCRSKNIDLVVVDPILHEGERVSSTLVKENIERGNLKKINTYLTIPYFMDGVVEKGRGEGKKIGVPTANLHFSKDKLLLKNGVYSTITTIDGIKKKSVTSIGAKPTFNDHKITVETFITDENRDLYNKNIKIEFVNFIREIIKFNSSEELLKQIQLDLIN